jgi:hypothetical protein
MPDCWQEAVRLSEDVRRLALTPFGTRSGLLSPLSIYIYRYIEEKRRGAVRVSEGETRRRGGGGEKREEKGPLTPRHPGSFT